MTALALDLTRAPILLPDGAGMAPGTLSIADGLIVDAPVGRAVDLSGFWVLPGMVDMHGDAFERHVAPRRGANTNVDDGIVAAEAELAAAGVTTAVLAQFYSWEGGLRGPEFAGTVFEAIKRVKRAVPSDLIPQLRFEFNMLDDYPGLPEKIAGWEVPYVVFNDHLQHDRLAEGRRPKQLTGQALKAGRNPEDHWALLQKLHGYGLQIPEAVEALMATLAAAGVRLGSHDEHTAADRALWASRGAQISEFPETMEAAQAAMDSGGTVVGGSPNVVRGGSHKGNVGVDDLVAAGIVNALASDYHYPSMRRAAFMLADRGVCSFEHAWGLLSSGPAKALGLDDRGSLRAGLRADITIVDPKTRRVCGTIAGGQVSYLSGELATRFLA
ncbi:alpha-D-ribose 1-methylphosphonate 5-triphosphate diphosphatase [Chachezhania antarctica]|uniref:alpha-D-ribose 1-methylphosphonate 5-triphosphate diphosphatase n=1 Tax=Chachezhania antarctica TaxID=2340860 RepID=UPI000EB00573|nr:alpha-D-ribose 1-methylphosphonate 5-triphosphate diphosphatase [Chachezhania antarctica]